MANAMIKKLSPKTIIGDVKKIVKQYESDDIIPLYDLAGKARSFESGESNYGTWYAFKGIFEFISHLDHTKNGRANKAFVQEPVLSYLLEALSNHEEVEFAVRVSVRCDDSLPTGYEYLIDSLVEVQPAEELSHLRALMVPQPVPPPRLAAPKSGDAEPETAPAKPAKKGAK